MALAADRNCYLTVDAASSFNFTLNTDGSGTMVTYEDTQCKDAIPAVTSLTKAQLSVHQCVGKSKYYAFNIPGPPTSAPPTSPPTPDATAPTSTPTSAPTSAPTSTPTPTGTGSATTGNKSGASSIPFAFIATAFWMVGWVAGLLL